MHYDTKNFILNMRSLFVIGALLVMAAIVILIVRPFFGACKNGPAVFTKI